MSKLTEWVKENHPTFYRKLRNELLNAKARAHVIASEGPMAFLPFEPEFAYEEGVAPETPVDIIKGLFEENDWDRPTVHELAARHPQLKRISREALRRKVNQTYQYYQLGGKESRKLRKQGTSRKARNVG